jgi:hypothetical protein
MADGMNPRISIIGELRIDFNFYKVDFYKSVLKNWA